MAKKGNKPSSQQQTPSLQVTRTLEQSFEGPLPHPQILAEYNKIAPDLVERIITMAESETKHRHEIENSVLRANVWEVRLGQVFGFLIGIFIMSAAGYCAIHGAQIAGAIIGSSGIAGIVSVFIAGRKNE